MTAPDLIQLVVLREGPNYFQNKLNNYFTKYGVSARTHSHVDLRNLTEAQAMKIHREDFYDFYHFKDLPPKLRATVYTAGIMLGFSEAFRLLSQAAEFFPSKETLTDDLLAKVNALEPEITRARLGTLLLLWFSDHGLLQANIRSVLPRVMESVSL